MRPRLRAAVPASLALAIGLLLGHPRPAAAQQMARMQDRQAALIRDLLPTVVNITAFIGDTPPAAAMNAAATPPTADAGPADAPRPKRLLGSGFVIDPSGVILTNHHVIAGAYDIQVLFSDGTRRAGRVLATSPRIDLALVKVDAPRPLATVRWADSDRVQVGEPVFAVGNPLGIGLSVSAGIVSALNRDLADTPYDDFIQTDAAINHGNSGGPLFNRRGEVVGVDTAILSPTTGSVGVGFAIPSNDAVFCATHLLRDGRIRPGYLGVRFETVTADMADALGLGRPMGSIISAIDAAGPAAAGGLRVGDVVLRYDGRTRPDSRALMRAIAESSVGRAVPLTILRDRHAETVRVTPADWPGTADAAATAGPAVQVPADLGLRLDALTPALRAQYGLTARQTGVLVGGVLADTDAFERGMRPGDVIVGVQDGAVAAAQDVRAAVEAARAAHRAFVLALVQSKAPRSPRASFGESPAGSPGAHWIALRVTPGGSVAIPVSVATNPR